MKRILGLDLGTTSIGWALVNEAENEGEESSIVRLGVRVNPLTTDEQLNFEKGKSITSNADRTLKRSMRRNLQRYKLRRENLIELLKQHGLISDETLLNENGNASTFRTYQQRAKAASERIELDDFARVLLMINKKRGYKSSRKAKNKDEGELIDGMEVAKLLYENNYTPGQYVDHLFAEGKSYIPDFYRSDLQAEFDKVWEFQKTFFPEIFTDEGSAFLKGKNKKATADYFIKELKITTPEFKGNAAEKRRQRYQLRSKAVHTQLTIGEVAEVLIEINGNIAASSGYLGAISDRSKELIFTKRTVGEYLWDQLTKDSHIRLKGQVFYRQDYLDEFEKIWSEQAKHHKVLSNDLKEEIRDVVIFYQRRLKSQKGLISFCEFESTKKQVLFDGKQKTKTIGLRVCPRSSPLFQEFKIWQVLNNLEVTDKNTGEKAELELSEKELLFDELSVRNELTKSEVLSLLFEKPANLDLNFEKIDGNKTFASLFNSYNKIVEALGHEEFDFKKLSATEIRNGIAEIFKIPSINPEILRFDSTIEGKQFEQQASYRLWHLLYSYEDDTSATGNEKLISKLSDYFGFPKEFARILSGITFQPDYGSLSAKAIRKILPYLKAGHKYDLACAYAGYNHSSSLTKEERMNRKLEPRMEILSRNSLRNPVVEKILNQAINVVNAVIDEYKKPDEVRIELARELKKSADERKKMSEGISRANIEHEKFRKILKEEFGLPFVSRNDIVRYKLYKELECRGFKTLYTNTYIPAEKLFSKEFDIEHIIPKSRLFDDSFSNKTLELRSANIEKGDDTALDFVTRKYGEDGLERYKLAVSDFFKQNGGALIAKRKKLLMKGDEIPNGFIDRELRDTQYIAKKAKELLEQVFETVNTTTGAVTERLREDWQLIDVMQELNWEKYRGLGLTYYEVNKDGQKIPKIKDWTKRNDHRHHAMDALTVAFTKRSHVQYLNNLNARSDKSGSIYGIEQKELYRDDKKRLRFKPPIQLDKFRSEAKLQMEKILVSHKTKNKVVTQNRNKIKIKGGWKIKTELTPRGQMHLETVYGSIKQYKTIEVKVGSSFDASLIRKVAKKKEREALLKRLEEFGNDPKKAFTGKNSLDKNPVYTDAGQTTQVPVKVKLVEEAIVYTIRKEIKPDLNVEKVVDSRIRSILEQRLEEYKGNAKKAFENLDENPIWLNKEKGIKIKRVRITGVANAVSIHSRINKQGDEIPVDFVNTGNNHHVAIYRDQDGNLQDDIKSFYEVVERVNQGIPIIDTKLNGWEFLFSMKQNELFVFPNEDMDFDPSQLDLMDEKNYHLISPNLFRVQKLSKGIYGNAFVRDFVFRHHLETTLNDIKELKETAFKRVQSLSKLNGVIKARLNHLGKIVQVGEY